MARRKRKQGSSVGDVKIKAFATLFIVLVMIGSFLLFTAWVYFELRLRKLFSPKSIHDFDNSPEELKEMNFFGSELKERYLRKERISIEGRSLKVRQDGSYDERSKKGKEFNQELEVLNPEIREYEKDYNEIKSRPEKRLDNWAFFASMPIALRISSGIYILVFSLCAWLEPKWVIQLSYSLKNLSMLDFYSSYPIAYGASVGALLFSSLSLLISYFWISFEKKEELRNRKLKSDENLPLRKEVRRTPSVKELSVLSHADLKSIVLKYGIHADKRSKASILEAIKKQDEEIVNNIIMEQRA